MEGPSRRSVARFLRRRAPLYAALPLHSSRAIAGALRVLPSNPGSAFGDGASLGRDATKWCIGGSDGDRSRAYAAFPRRGRYRRTVPASDLWSVRACSNSCPDLHKPSFKQWPAVRGDAWDQRLHDLSADSSVGHGTARAPLPNARAAASPPLALLALG